MATLQPHRDCPSLLLLPLATYTILPLTCERILQTLSHTHTRREREREEEEKATKIDLVIQLSILLVVANMTYKKRGASSHLASANFIWSIKYSLPSLPV